MFTTPTCFLTKLPAEPTASSLGGPGFFYFLAIAHVFPLLEYLFVLFSCVQILPFKAQLKCHLAEKVT